MAKKYSEDSDVAYRRLGDLNDNWAYKGEFIDL